MPSYNTFRKTTRCVHHTSKGFCKRICWLLRALNRATEERRHLCHLGQVLANEGFEGFDVERLGQHNGCADLLDARRHASGQQDDGG